MISGASQSTINASQACAYYATGEVRWRVVDGRAVLLDLLSGEYVVFDQIATSMWKLLLTVPTEQRVAVLQEQFDAPTALLKKDISAFTKTCLERGFIQIEPLRPIEHVYNRPIRKSVLALRAWWALGATACTLRVRGFPATYKNYSRMPKPACDRELPVDLLVRAQQAFSKAENFFVMKTAPKDCLPRSLALYRFLILIGIPVEHCIGVLRYPFGAHAWVEFQGKALFDQQDYVRSYAVLARM
jgi:hypothetical protein